MKLSHRQKQEERNEKTADGKSEFKEFKLQKERKKGEKGYL